jgi:hypothetical protein
LINCAAAKQRVMQGLLLGSGCETVFRKKQRELAKKPAVEQHLPRSADGQGSNFAGFLHGLFWSVLASLICPASILYCSVIVAAIAPPMLYMPE